MISSTVTLLRDITVSHKDTLGEYNLIKVASSGDIARIIGYDPQRGMHVLRRYHDFLAKEGVDFEYAKASSI